ncbi:hypothetical protein A4D02_14310 [Niastella koreensis]|uniref:Uncharacterized protein n=2 Tax=Niastella koreensis TaxID=354356 RepID=G8TRK0_NIAKG|nr:hypothetical protein [Niastella koreensis]AEW01131.1 hypothetical protein Niako_4889 [Niastella koreensis GR20-10]OQP40666.1 hypothetical protein A4D02_14310 [Niastella koreensis]
MPKNRSPKNDTQKSADIVEALGRPEPPQDREGKNGDPQLAALTSFLLGLKTNNTVSEKRVLVDFGCGNGVLPNLLESIYNDAPDSLPFLWAVDLPEPLSRLALPLEIHNRSEKCTLEMFYNNKLINNSKEITEIVIRNVLHEMTIKETAELFDRLIKYLPVHTNIYIQDMARLPKQERGNAAWSFELLKQCLEEMGFTVSGHQLYSHSGIPWFSMNCQLPTSKKDANMLDIIAKYRSKQLTDIRNKGKELTKVFENTSEIISLSLDCLALDVQLDEIGWFNDSPTVSLKDLNIPLTALSKSPTEYAAMTNAEIASPSGLVAMLSTKNMLDFPTLIKNAKEEISFGGYSNRPLFLKIENKTALKEAIGKGIKVKVLVVNPQSTAAQLRANEPLYKDPKNLIESINNTIEQGKNYFRELQLHYGEFIASKYYDLRASSRIPKWSYFIIDDKCYLSFYSMSYSGSSGPCFVFQNVGESLHNYYHVVRQEFLTLFEESNNLLT